MKKLLATIVVASTMTLLWTASALATTYFVDAPNPAIECPSADFPSIQAAVAVAQPGDQIRVCPGIYRERVVVNKADISLLGAGPDPHIRTGDPTQEAVLDAAGPADTAAFDLQANAIDVAGFTIQRRQRGIRTDTPFTGFTISRNLFLNDVIGFDLRSGPGPITDIEQNIQLARTGGNDVVANQSEDNLTAGLAADAASAGNTLEQNLSDNNLGFDCEDDSVGPGTGGTANFWLNDLGDTANRPGICEPTGRPADTAAAQATASAQAAAVIPPDCIDLAIADDPAAADAFWSGVIAAGADPWPCEPALMVDTATTP